MREKESMHAIILLISSNKIGTGCLEKYIYINLRSLVIMLIFIIRSAFFSDLRFNFCLLV